MTKPPKLTDADFSIDGGRIRISVARLLHLQGWRFCPKCRKVRELHWFGMHARAREISGYCADCARKRKPERT